MPGTNGPTAPCSSFAAPGWARQQASELIVAGLSTRVAAPVLCTTVVSSAFAAAAATAGLKTILHVHELPTSIDMYVGSEAFLTAARACDTIVTVSNFARRALADAFPELEARLELMHESVPAETVAAGGVENAQFLRSLGPDPHPPIVLWCGPLPPRQEGDLFPELSERVFRARGVAEIV